MRIQREENEADNLYKFARDGSFSLAMASFSNVNLGKIIMIQYFW